MTELCTHERAGRKSCHLCPNVASSIGHTVRHWEGTLAGYTQDMLQYIQQVLACKLLIAALAKGPTTSPDHLIKDRTRTDPFYSALLPLHVGWYRAALAYQVVLLHA